MSTDIEKRVDLKELEAYFLCYISIPSYDDLPKDIRKSKSDIINEIKQALQQSKTTGIKEGMEKERERIGRAITSLIPTTKDPEDALFHIQQLFTNN